jgi:membrane protease YdiL (CAAX protease family)
MNPLINQTRSIRSLIEVILMFALMAVLLPVNNSLYTLAGLIPIAYYFLEGWLRKRSLKGPDALFADVKRSWYWILLVAIGMQTLDAFVFHQFVPEMAEHLRARTPLLEEGFDPDLLLTFAILALGEEIAFRGVLQERLSWYLKPYVAIPLTSAIFALVHVSRGSALIVGLDLASVFLDSLVFGIIYHQTRNVWVSWVAHFTANVLAYFYIVSWL